MLYPCFDFGVLAYLSLNILLKCDWLLNPLLKAASPAPSPPPSIKNFARSNLFAHNHSIGVRPKIFLKSLLNALRLLPLFFANSDRLHSSVKFSSQRPVYHIHPVAIPGADRNIGTLFRTSLIELDKVVGVVTKVGIHLEYIVVSVTQTPFKACDIGRAQSLLAFAFNHKKAVRKLLLQRFYNRGSSIGRTIINNQYMEYLFQFKIWNNYKFKQTRYEREYINENKEDYWEELVYDNPKIHTLYKDNIENELIKNDGDIPGEKIDYSKLNIVLPNESTDYENYSETYYELRKEKNVTLAMAQDLMEDEKCLSSEQQYLANLVGGVMFFSINLHIVAGTNFPSSSINGGFSMIISLIDLI
jgi:hypothetical protein